MSSFSTPAIMLRRIDFGDYDFIITFFTLNSGKIPVIAKSARKSIKRFSGILELFYALDIVLGTGRGKGLPVLQEASLRQPFYRIRENITKTAYASYWAELINEWMENHVKNIKLYHLFQYVLYELDLGRMPEEVLSILFQIKLISMSGFYPNLRKCSICKVEMEKMKGNRIVFDIIKGGIVCERCKSGSLRQICLSKGTIKQILWIEGGDLSMAERIRFSPEALKECLKFLEVFVPYHLGKEPKSLKFLRQIRKD